MAARRNNLPIEVLTKRMDEGLCSQCGMTTLLDELRPVDDDEHALQGRCLLCYPLGWTPPDGDGNGGAAAVRADLMMERIDRGRCETCEMMTRIKDGPPINNEHTLMGRCLLCNPLSNETAAAKKEEATDEVGGGDRASAGGGNEDDGNDGGGHVRRTASSTNRRRRGRRGIKSDDVEREEVDRRPSDGGGQSGRSATLVTPVTRRARGAKNRPGSDVDGSTSGESDGEGGSDGGNPSPRESRVQDSPSSGAHGTEDVDDQVAKKRKQARRSMFLKSTKQRRAKKAKIAAEIGEDVFEAIALARNEPFDAEIQEEAFKLVKKCVNEESVAEVLVDEEDIIDLVLSAMENHGENSDVTLECLWVLGRIAWVRPETYSTMIAEKGGVEKVISMLKHDPKDARDKRIIAKNVLGTLIYILATPFAVVELAMCGGVDAVIEAMCCHCRAPEIHATGCKVMQEILHNNGEAARSLVEAGAFRALVAGMRHKVTEEALLAITNLLLDDNSRLQFVEEGGLDVLIPFLRQKGGKRSPGIMETAMDAFRYLVSVHSSGSRFVEGVLVPVISAGGFTAIQAAMRKYSDNDSLQLLGCQALYELIFDESSADEVVNAGCMPTLINAMETHRESSDIQEAGCNTLGKLFAEKDVCDQRSLEAVVGAMQAHPEEGDVQSNGCAALLDAYSTSPSIRDSFECPRIDNILTQASSKFPEQCGKDVRELMRKKSDRVTI